MAETGQLDFTGYGNAGIHVAVDLVNELALRSRTEPEALQALRAILEFDPPTHERLRRRHVPGFLALAATLREVIWRLSEDDLDRAAHRVNELLTDHPANPHLAKYEGRWRLHHHPASVDLVPMYTSICAEILARLIDHDGAHRLGFCADPTCGRAFLDQSKNSSRRYCSITCQNRAKTAAFRARQRAGTPGPGRT